jgi:hypothetical protein
LWGAWLQRIIPAIKGLTFHLKPFLIVC